MLYLSPTGHLCFILRRLSHISRAVSSAFFKMVPRRGRFLASSNRSFEQGFAPALYQLAGSPIWHKKAEL